MLAGELIRRLTPAAYGYHMPAEWEPHAATWLAWPYNLETWGGHLPGAEEVYVRLIEILTKREHVELCVPNSRVAERAHRMLSPLKIPQERLRFHTIETGDVWFRDFGPIFIVRDRPLDTPSRVIPSVQPLHAEAGCIEGATRLGTRGDMIGWTKWHYNALGNKWGDLLVGDTVPAAMPIQDLPHFEAGIVLEGGSIDVNGRGSLLTTESCLLNPNRNPHLSREKIEQMLGDYLGVRNVLWLAGGIEGDDTDGHVDDVTRFVGPSTVATMLEEDPSDNNYATLLENYERLQSMRDEHGQSLRIVTFPMPRPLFKEERRMAASYANFYIANGIVAVPTYDQPSDNIALQTLQELFPDRHVIGIDCRELIYGYGALHCVTQQQCL